MAGAAKGAEPTGRVRLGDLLVRHGLITPKILEDALKTQRQSGKQIGEILLAHGHISESQLIPVLASQLKVGYTDVPSLILGSDELSLLPEAMARKYTALPIRRQANRLEVVMADPLDFEAIRDLSFATGMKVSPSLGGRGQILEAIDRFYARHLEGAGALMAAGVGDTTEPLLLQRADEARALDPDAEDAPVIQLLNLIMRKAIQLGASDIHIEPGTPEGTVRFRLDGLLADQLKVPPRLQPALISRLKILGRLDIAERRLPQDGSVRVKLEGREADLRISCIPLRAGEKAVIRVLDTSGGGMGLQAIGLSPADLKKVESLIGRHKGMVVATGPTGSGKTTMLYGVLNRIKSPTTNIVTVEDPIEYHYPGLNQMQVNADIGLTFAAGLRSILRQDPDIILVGEIRDAETAEIACRAALTGHLVFTTLHTNDAPTTITRLLDIGIPRYLVASVLIGIIAQRLVRTVCPDCKAPASPDAAAVVGLGLSPASLAGGQYMAGKGCLKCQESGYKGRTGVFEILLMDSRIRDLILRGSTEEDIRLAAQEAGMQNLVENGLAKAKAGVTTIDELVRVLEVSEHVATSCPGCGRHLNSEYRHCPYCRTVLRRVCSSCGRLLQAGWAVCSYCGQE
jgi:type II secretory ATPase GspE/PulE/Tfp pilus assembly ATPase PilB-like protein